MPVKPVSIDLTHHSARSLKAKPPELFGKFGPFRINFPSHMTSPPAWMVGLELDAVVFPDFAGRTLRIPHRSVRVVGASGDRLAKVIVPHPARVVATGQPSGRPFVVDWLNESGNVVRRGGPDNTPFSIAEQAGDEQIPVNGSVKFSKPGSTDRTIWCRHYVELYDAHHSSVRRAVRPGNVGSPGPSSVPAGTRPASPAGASQQLLSAYADFSRAKLKDVATTQKNIPFDYQARYIKTFEMSRNPAIVGNDALGQWARRQFDGMRLGDSRTFVVATPAHAMNITLDTYRREDGRRAYRLVLLDPNCPTQPLAIETSKRSDVDTWSMAHLMDDARIAAYFEIEEIGLNRPSSLIVETPRGTSKAAFDQEPTITPSPLPEIGSFPPDHLHTPADLGSFDLLGYEQNRVADSMRAASRNDVRAALHISHAVVNNLSCCDPKAVERHFTLLQQLFMQGSITPTDAANAVRTRSGADSLAAAVTLGRSKSLEAYRDGLRSLARIGALTDAETDLFDHLLDQDALESVEAARRSDDPARMSAAKSYEDICELIMQLQISLWHGRSDSSDHSMTR